MRGYADRGVQLLRQPERRGKTAAEALAARNVDGEIVINTDASIRIAPDAVRPLVARFQDPKVGVASGRDVSVSRLEAEQNVGEAGYVGYEMAVRDAETRLYGIVGASGSFYGIRTHLHRLPLPEQLSRDFAAALHAEEHGYRAVSVPEAVAYVPRAGSLKAEYRRKVRTMGRGMRTLWYKRHLLNPFRHPTFAWMLWSHKIARWALPWAALGGLLALLVLAPRHPWAAVMAGLALLALGHRRSGLVAQPRRTGPATAGLNSRLCPDGQRGGGARHARLPLRHPARGVGAYPADRRGGSGRSRVARFRSRRVFNGSCAGPPIARSAMALLRRAEGRPV